MSFIMKKITKDVKNIVNKWKYESNRNIEREMVRNGK